MKLLFFWAGKNIEIKKKVTQKNKEKNCGKNGSFSSKPIKI